MPLFATFATACLSLQPQGPAAAQEAALLTPAEQKSLQSKLSRLLEAHATNDDSTSGDRAREKAQKAYEQAKEAFFTEWEARSEKKGELLKSVPDLQAIFANCIPYERRSAVSLRRIDEREGIPAHFLSVPKSYRAEQPCRAILLVPGLDEKGEWIECKKWFDATWGEKATAVGDTIFHLPVLGKGTDLDPMPDYSKSEGEMQEFRRNGELLHSFGETQRSFNVDRGRLLLDAGKGACAFALRAATHFPDRFAGLVLRHPTAVDEIRLGSLGGLAVLLLSSPATEADCKALKERFDAMDPKQCTILATTDAYPFKAAAPEIEKWMAGVHRVVNRTKVVLEPNDDRFKKGFWVGIESMDSIHATTAANKPRVEVEADRAQNRIVIKAVGVESLVLQLNDALLDLDKDFTIVVNDKAITDKRRRDFNEMYKLVRQRFDSDFLFPAQMKVRVPKPETKVNDAGVDK